jgi:flavin reductase (DIM6/NTAB) family NADH-FMN oxidoreductase RutF
MPLKFVPEFIKRRLRPLPQWAVLGMHESHDPVAVWLTAGGVHFDVTQNHVIAALKPLMVAVGLTEPLRRALDGDRAPLLTFSDRQSGRFLASLRLQRQSTLQVGNTNIALFHIEAYLQRCVRWPYRAWNHWLQARVASRNTDATNFAMTPASQQQVMILYIRPRPVVLVSVEYGEHGNIFPMDLIGPVSPDLFTLALRSTSHSVDAMKLSRRLAISDLAACDVKIAHDLGRHHRRIQIDWGSLPFAVDRSAHFSLPVPAIALRIRELEIIHAATVGSHTLFVCRQISERRVRDALPLCHTSGIYQHFRSRQARAMGV